MKTVFLLSSAQHQVHRSSLVLAQLLADFELKYEVPKMLQRPALCTESIRLPPFRMQTFQLPVITSKSQTVSWIVTVLSQSASIKSQPPRIQRLAQPYSAPLHDVTLFLAYGEDPQLLFMATEKRVNMKFPSSFFYAQLSYPFGKRSCLTTISARPCYPSLRNQLDGAALH